MKSTPIRLLFLVIALSAYGCATTSLPDSASISALPVIELGQKAPDNKEYRLLLRAGKNIPVTLTLSGSLLADERKVSTEVQIKRDVYLYKKWSSFDGKTWGKKNINLLIGTGVDSAGGIVNITVDDIAQQ